MLVELGNFYEPKNGFFTIGSNEVIRKLGKSVRKIFI